MIGIKNRSPRWIHVFGSQAPLGYVLVLPLLLVMIGLLAYPVFSAVLLSFQDKSLGSPGVFIGLDNYIELLTSDNRFWTVVTNSVLFTVGSVGGKLVIGMGMALLLNQRLKGRNFFRGWLLLPWIAPTFVSALTWRWMWDGTSGVINYVLVGLGIMDSPITWLGNGTTALGAVIATNIWRGFPFFGVSLLAALQAIPTQLYEAADVDGASPWQKFLNVTLPSLRTVVLITTMLSTIWTINDFAIVYVMTGGGPSYATHLFATYTYQLGFVGSRLGYATAVSTTLLPVLIIMILALSPIIMKSESD